MSSFAVVLLGLMFALGFGWGLIFGAVCIMLDKSPYFVRREWPRQ